MGERNNIKLRFSCSQDESKDDLGNSTEERDFIYLYSHWGSPSLAGIVQTALLRNQRWADESYLARIIISEFLRGHEDEETGFGIAPYEADQDGYYNQVHVNLVRQEIIIGDLKATYKEFILLPPEILEKACYKDRSAS